MNLVFLAIYDSKAEAFLPPFTAQTTAVGIRTFAQAVNDENSPFHQHPGDYTLFHLGEFDQVKGHIIPGEAQLNLGLAATFIEATS